MFSNHRRPIGGVIAAIALAGTLFVGSARATTLDPQIFVQQSGSSPAGGDPNIILNTGAFTIGVAGNFILQDPLLVIVGVYDGSGTPAISFSGCTVPLACPLATAGTYGLTSNTATMGPGQFALVQLGLSGDGSESFTNWSGADVADGFAAPTSFSLYAFALATNLTSGSPITIDESGAAPGSFIIGYDCKNGTGSSAGCATQGDIGQTPFTNAGLICLDGPACVVPEPATLALFGAGLASLGLALRRRLKKG